ncbi:hypothetical protein AVEN_95509-1 [Araneus ventricosus]|uniref:Uncharacterized protein n=1 Tax=Araneus ventricosus TaxID=182803 RepID=A0A4Y2WHW3_ARAVE|nr:hypothetical protein AVEN_95509-1 [Araneus ventricosus]
MLGQPLCTNFAITKLLLDYVMHSSFAYRQFNINFACGDPTILPYELIHSRNRGTVGHSVRLILSMILRFTPHNVNTTGLWCNARDTDLRTPLSQCDKFVKHASLLREEIG